MGHVRRSTLFHWNLSNTNVRSAFDLVIIKFCADESISVPERQERINSYIKVLSPLQICFNKFPFEQFFLESERIRDKSKGH